MGQTIIAICFQILFFLKALTGQQEIDFFDALSNVFYADPDSKGYRHCAYWKLADGTQLYSTCDPFSLNRCGRPMDFKYDCCPGFTKNEPGAFFRGCSRIISPYKSCVESILQSDQAFAGMAPRLASVDTVRQTNQPYTIFTPMLRNGEQISNPRQYVVRGRQYLNNLRDGMKLETLDGERTLYVSRYPYGIISINCVEVMDANLECKNGLIHRLRRPMKGDDEQSILKALQTLPETSLFAEDLPEKLKYELDDINSGKRYTVLAPGRQSWEEVRKEFQGDKLQQIAASHVIPKQRCASDMIRSYNTEPTSDGKQVTIECDIDDQKDERRRVISACGEKRTLVDTDYITANGVIHRLDQAIIPLSVYPLKYLQENPMCGDSLRIKEFVKLMKECDLKMKDGEKYTIILPQDESFLWWSNYEQFRGEYQRFLTDKEYRCRIARYHIVKDDGGLSNIRDFSSNTMGHRTNNEKNNLYETTYFKRTPSGPELNFHYSSVPEFKAIEMDGVSIYLTPRVNVFPEQNISDIIANRPDTRLTNNKTIEANMNDKHFKKNAPKNLYLVTTDDGWKDPRAKPGSKTGLRPEYTMYSKKFLETFLLLHHVPLYLWGGDIGYFDKNTVHKFNSSSGMELTFWMDENGVMRIGYDDLPVNQWPRVVKWNLPGRDGIVWLLDGILKCPERLCPLFVQDIDYYDVYVAACQTAHFENEPDIAQQFKEKPIQLATKHQDKCIVVLQLSEHSVHLIETR